MTSPLTQFDGRVKVAVYCVCVLEIFQLPLPPGTTVDEPQLSKADGYAAYQLRLVGGFVPPLLRYTENVT